MLGNMDIFLDRITSYNVCYTKLLRFGAAWSCCRLSVVEGADARAAVAVGKWIQLRQQRLAGPAAHLPVAAFLGDVEKGISSLPGPVREAIGSGGQAVVLTFAP